MQTSLLIDGKRVAALTIPTPEGLVIELWETDENYKPIGQPDKFVHELTTEKDFHIALRLDAQAKNHFVKEFSTDPDLNPIEDGK